MAVRTKGDSLFAIGHMIDTEGHYCLWTEGHGTAEAYHLYAELFAALAALEWSNLSGYASSQCGRRYHASSMRITYELSGHVYLDATADGYDCQFEIAWPAVPAGATNVRYIIQEESYIGGVYQWGLRGGTEQPVGTYDPTSSNVKGTSGQGGSTPAIPGEDYKSFSSPDGTVCCAAWIEYTTGGEEPECDKIGVPESSLTATGATLYSPIDDVGWEWGVEGSEVHTDSEDGILTGLQPDTWYWYRQPGVCSKTFWFKTKKEDSWAASIITLPATEVWATGATMHGLFWYKGNSKFYVALGFEWGLGALTGTNIRWIYTLGQPARRDDIEFKMPIQITVAGLLPDTTYCFRACLHVHNSNGTLTPMNTNNYFGETLSFGGPVSMFGFGREYVTAKKAEDDVSRMAAGRYYMDKNGVFQYESYQRRKMS